MKEPVDHILRPRLPWRSPDDAPITECGYDATKTKTITRDQFRERLKDLGRQRSALLTCMTCSDTASRWGAWDDDPRLAVGREVEWERRSAYFAPARHERGTQLKDELLVIAELIEAHREEFDARIVELKARRDWNQKKLELARRPKVAHPPTGL